MVDGIITDSSQLNGPVLWPDDATSETVTDLAPPLRLLLVDMGVSPKPEDADSTGFAKVGIDVPPSVAIIEAGATEFSKASAQQLKISALLAGAGGAVAAFWSGANTAIRVDAIAAAGFVLAALLVSIAVIVSSDVRARGIGAAAQYEARARVAEAYLRGAVSLGAVPPTGAAPTVNGQANGHVAAKGKAAKAGSRK